MGPRWLGDQGQDHLHVVRACPSFQASAIPGQLYSLGRRRAHAISQAFSRTLICQTKSLTEDDGNKSTKATFF